MGVILTASYYDKGKINSIGKKVGAKPLMVDMSVTGEGGSKDVFAMFETIVDRLVAELK